MTIPALMTKISDTVKEKKIAVFERKLSKGADLLNIEYGIGPYYKGANPSYEFAQALSKHLKIVTICDKDNLRNCLPYEQIQTDINLSNVSDLKTGSKLGLDSTNYVDTAGIVLGDGTPMIFSWNKNCPVSDPDSVEYSVSNKKVKSLNTNCISGIYDINGAKGPNKFGKDVISFNGASLGWIKIGNLEVSPAFIPTPIEVSSFYSDPTSKAYKLMQATGGCWNWGLSSTNNKKNYWAGAFVQCDAMGGTLTTQSQANTIASKILYNGQYRGTALAEDLGLPSKAQFDSMDGNTYAIYGGGHACNSSYPVGSIAFRNDRFMGKFLSNQGIDEYTNKVLGGSSQNGNGYAICVKKK